MRDLLVGGMSHFDLCHAIAEKVGVGKGKAWVTLYEYQGYATDEFPDVLAFSGGETILYEIKTSRSDFLADAKKEARKKWRPKVSWWFTGAMSKRVEGYMKAEVPELYYIQAPHLGSYRFFVCEPGIIEVKDLPEGWGLCWFKGGRMYSKAPSKRWRPNLHMERNILAHAFRRYASGDRTGILVNTYAEISQAAQAEEEQR